MTCNRRTAAQTLLAGLAACAAGGATTQAQETSGQGAPDESLKTQVCVIGGGVGTAIAAKMDKSPRRVFVITGDGELQEGSNWEAAMSAAHHKLDNLTVIIDRNGLQQGDYTESTNRLEPLADKWRAFGWEVVEVDGHDHAALLDLFQRVPLQEGKPTCVLAHTHKGQGVSFVKDQVGWHHRVMTQEELAQALVELGEVQA